MIMTSHTTRGYQCRRLEGNNGADVDDDETDGAGCCYFCGCSDGVKFCSRSRSGNHRRRRSIVAYAVVWFLLIGLSQQQSTPSGSGSVDTDVIFSSSRTDDAITSTPAYDTYCETESFNATCDAPNDVILITHARYGRMRLSRCAKIDYGHIGCASDVLELADSRCSGRKSCEIAIPDALFAKSQPCPEDLKPYLEVGYSCMAVENPSVTCPFPGSLIISAYVRLPFRVSSLPGNATAGLGNTASTARAAAAAAFHSTKSPQPVASKRQQNSAHVEGFLSNWVTETTGCGGLTSPWLIETDIGRRIHLTLFDFHVARASRPTGFVRPRCPLYAVVREQVPVLPLSSSFSASGSTHDAAAPAAHVAMATGTGSRKQTICGGGHEREKIVYRSETNRIEVGLARTDDAIPGGGPYFMLKYEVVGCADLAPIHGATMVRNGDLLTVKCNNSRDEYHLKCVNMQWVGNIHNCTTVSSLSTAAEKVLDGDRGSGLTGSSGTYDGSSSSSSSSSGGSGAGGSNGVVISYGSSVVIVLITALAIGLLVLSAGLMILTRRKATLNARRRGKAVGSRGASGSVRRSARGDYDKDGITSGRLLCNVDGVYGAREVSPSTTTTASGSNVIYVDTLTLPCAGCNSRAGSGDCDCAAAAAGHLMHHHMQQQQQQQARHIFPPQSHSLHHHHHHYQQQHCHHPSSVGPQNLLLVSSSDSPGTAQFCGDDDRIPEVVTVYEPTSGRLLGCAASFRNSTVGSSATVENEPSVSSPPNVVADVIGPDVTAFPVNVVPGAGTGNVNTLTKPLGTNSTAVGQLQTDDLKFLQKSHHDSRKERHRGGIRTAVSGGSGRRSVVFNSLDVSTGPAVVASPGEADPLLTSTTNATATGGIYDGVAGSGPGSIHTGGPRRLPPPPGTQIVASNDCSMPVEDLRAPRVLLS